MNSQNTYRPLLVLAPGVMAGAEKVVLTGISALYKLGLNPLMIVIQQESSPIFAEIFIQNLPPYIEYQTIVSSNPFDLKLVYKLIKVIHSEKNPVVLHSHGFKALVTCYLASYKIPLIHTHHGNTGQTLKIRIYEKIAMIVMKRCNSIIAVSEVMKKELDSTLRPLKNIYFIDNMLSLENAKSIRAKRLAKEDTLTSKINLIFIGRLSPEKGLLQFLECFSQYSTKNNFHLTVLGDGVERIQIEEFIKKNNLESFVTLHGFVSDPSPYLISPDILIMPSLREGLPMTLIEALATGIPVIANNVGAIGSLVKNNFNGLLTKDNSVSSWTETLILTEQNFREWILNSELEAPNIEIRFSSHSWAEKTKAIYDHSMHMINKH